jgi:hypothetical protein
MEIGKFKLAKADLVRPPRKPIQEQIIPKEKPYTEDMFKEQADLYLKGFIGGFPQDEMLLKLQGILDKAVEQGLVKPEAGLNYFRNRKQELLDFAKENPGQTLPELNRDNFAIGGGVIQGQNLGTREGFKEPIIRKGKVGTDNEGLFSVRATNVSEADNIPGAVKFGAEQVYFNTEEEAKDYIKNKEKYFKPTIGKNKIPSDDPVRLKKIDDYVKQFEKDYGKKPTAKNIRTALNEQARVIDIYEAKYNPLPKGTAITNVDTDVFKILKDPNVIKKLEAGKFPSITDISKITKLDPVLSETRLMDVAEKLANTKYANVAKNYLENTSLVNPDSPYGGLKGKRARIILENRFTKGMGVDQKLPNLRKDILDEIYKIIPELKGKGFLAVDEIAGLTSSMRGGFSPYPIFGQVTSSDFNTIQKGGTIDRTKGFLERKLKELKPGDPERAKLQKQYNDKVSSFVRESNIGNPAKKVKAFKLSFKPPSQTIKNKKVYNQFKDLFDEHYKKYGYSFEIPKDTESLLDIRDKLKTNKSFRNTVKQNFNKLIKSKGGKIGTAAFLATVTPTAFALADEKIADEKPVEGTKEGLPYEAALPTAVAAGKYTPQLLKILGNLGKVGIKTIGSPTVGLYYSGKELTGEDPNLAFAGAEMLLPEIGKAVSTVPGAKGRLAAAGRFALNPFQALEKLGKYGKIGRAAAMGARIPSLMTPVGVGLIGIEGIRAGMREQDRINTMRETDPEAYEQYIADQEEMLRQSAAYGGRIGFAEGPEDPSKRKFMKIMGGLASLPIVGRFFDIAPVAYNAAEDAAKIIKGAPLHFMGLVNKIRALGKIVEPEKLMPSDQKRYSNVYDYGDYRMYEGKDGQIEIAKDRFMATDYGDAKVSEEYMSYNPKSPKYNKKGELTGETEPQYDEYTAYADQEGKMKDVYDGIEESTKMDGTYSKEELEQLIIEQIENDLKKGKK